MPSGARTPHLAAAVRQLRQAVERAEQALAVLTPIQETRGVAFAIHVSGLAALALCATEELRRVERGMRDNP